VSWTPIADEQIATARAVVLWIRTVRDAGGFGYGPGWLPSEPDFTKSALFERIRSGKAPLEHPPPLGYACPWYALIEDAGPHYAFDVSVSGGDFIALQNRYTVVERRGEAYVIKDARRETPYRFKAWYDAEWRHPGGRFIGGWFLQNVAFANEASP
jgi:hypothetical protein